MNSDRQDTVFDRPLPGRPDVERMIFGAALTDPCAFQQIADVLWAGDFSLEKHHRIFLRPTEVHGRGEELNYVSGATELEKRGQLASIDGLSYLVSLTDGMPQLASLAGFCNLVRGAAIKRQATLAMTGLIDRCFAAGEGAEDLLGEAERVSDILNSSLRRVLDARTFEQVIADEGGINPFMAPEAKPGIHLPFADIHATLGGLR